MDGYNYLVHGRMHIEDQVEEQLWIHKDHMKRIRLVGTAIIVNLLAFLLLGLLTHREGLKSLTNRNAVGNHTGVGQDKIQDRLYTIQTYMLCINTRYSSINQYVILTKL